MSRRSRALCASMGVSMAAGCGTAVSEDQPLCACKGELDWICTSAPADGVVELAYAYEPQDVVDRVAGRWSGRYPGGRRPAFDVSVEVAVADDAEVLYGVPMALTEGDALPDEAFEECAFMAITAEVTVSHEDVQGVSFDTEARSIFLRGHELADAFTEQQAESAAPSGVPGFQVQNTTDEPYQEGDDDEVEFLFGPDETLWILERQPPYRASGERIAD